LIGSETESLIYGKQWRGSVIIAIVKGVMILPNIGFENTVRNRDSDPN
jgi:hypothetical protein